MVAVMNNFKGGGFKKGGKDFGGRPKFGGNKSGGGSRFGSKFSKGKDNAGRAPELFSTTCSQCKKTCEVPFRPSADKPVYCSACFGKKSLDEGRQERGVYNKRDVRKERPDYTKLPRAERPARHDRPAALPDRGIEDLKLQLTKIESRLNRILDLMNPPTPPQSKLEKSTDLPEVKVPVEKSKLKTKVVKKAVKKVAKKTVKKVAKKTK